MAVQVSVKLSGVEFAKARLATIQKSVEPVMRGALNTTATRARRERYVKPMGRSLKSRRLNSALKVKRANSRNMNSRIIPSSSGILVMNYQSWGFDILTPTRARIWVLSPEGKKVAAGFVNPASAKKLPWSTRSKRSTSKRDYIYAGWKTAMGPSAAYWFKLLTTPGTTRWVNAFLMREFERRIRQEIAKATT